MTNSDQLAEICKPGTPTTLAELRSALLADPALPVKRRREMISAVTTLAKALGRLPESITTAPVGLRPLLDGLTPAMAGLRTGRWKNLLSLLAVALAHVGIVTIQGRLRTAPSPEWATILALLPANAGRHFHLWRFARWSTGQSIAPGDVTDATLERFRVELKTRSLVAEPDRGVREIARIWNAATATYPAWPQQRLALPDNRGTFSPDWPVYPASLRIDVEEWAKGLGDPDPFTDRPAAALRPASVNSRRKQVRVYLAALVRRGVDPAELTSLAAAVTPHRAAIGLRFFWERAGCKPSVYTSHLSSLVLMVARHWARLPKADLEKLAAMAAKLRPEPAGLSNRNITRLLQFDDPLKLEAMLLLPQKLARLAGALGAPSPLSGLLMQSAVAIELLLNVPMRLGNLRGLRLGVHLRPDPGGAITCAIDPDEIKNGVALSVTLPEPASRLIRRYIDDFRPVLVTVPSDFLFPGRQPGQPKSDPGFRKQLQDVIAEHVGIAFNPHGFRHLAAYLILRENPGAHGQVQRVLGHKSLASTMAFYSGLEAAGAVGSYDRLIARQRESLISQGARP